jgi:LytS/YehU family sensor histidine kinase
LSHSVLWLALSWVIFRMIDGTAARPRVVALPLAGLTMLGCTTAGVVVKAWLLTALGPFGRLTFAEELTNLVRGDFYLTLMWVTAIAALGRGLQWWHVEESGALRLARLESRATEAALAVVAAQLEPHFLFNTLAGIATLAARDRGRAHEMIDGLLALLEYPTRDCRAVPLRDEVGFAMNYLRLQQVRFPERLTVHLEIDEAALDCLVPHLILQPAVENAVTHGVEQTEDQSLVTIGATLAAEHLHLFVRNREAAGPAAHPQEGHGVGLAAAQARLDLLFGEGHILSIDRAADRNVTLRVTMPARRAAP